MKHNKTEYTITCERCYTFAYEKMFNYSISLCTSIKYITCNCNIIEWCFSIFSYTIIENQNSLKKTLKTIKFQKKKKTNEKKQRK